MKNEIKCLQRDSDHLYPHAVYIRDWTRKGAVSIWKPLLAVSPIVCATMIAEAINLPDFSSLQKQTNTKQYTVKPWYRPGNKEMVCVRNDGNTLTGLYQHDDYIYVVEAQLSDLGWYLNEHKEIELNKRMALAMAGKIQS